MNKLTTMFAMMVMLIAFSACSKKLSVISSDRDLENFSTDEFKFEYLQSKLKVRFQSPDQNISSSANLRIKADSAIWISLAPALGIELARGIITQDTIIFIDRFNKDVYAYNFKQLSQMLNFPVTFDILQAMLVGNMPLPLKRGDGVDKDRGKFLLSQQRGSINLTSEVDNDSRKLESIKMLEMPSANQMNITYDQFSRIDDEVFPFLGLISIIYKTSQGDEETSIRIEHSKVERFSTPLSFPFSIPDKYGMR